MTNALIRLLKNPLKFHKESLVPKFYKKFPVFTYFKKLSRLEEEFVKTMSYYFRPWNKQTNKIVLMQMVEDYTFCIKLTATASHLAKKENANIALYSVESRIERPHYPTNNLLKNILGDKLDKIYAFIGGPVLFRNTDQYDNSNLIREEFQSIKEKLHSKWDVLEIKIENIKIGDLIYDTYLRFGNKKTVDLEDPFLDEIILQALHIYYNSKSAIESNNIVALVNSYATYTKHGIIVRLCLQKNIPVYHPLGGFILLVHKSELSYPTHRNNHVNYKKLFNKLPNKVEIINRYKPEFEKRFEGVIDAATYYMKESAFSTNENESLKQINWNQTVVVLAHCFFDSPHIYRDLIFPDFYEWMTFTLDQLSLQKEITILVKQHPNGLPKNDEIFDELKQKYNHTNIQFIDKKTSQLQIIRSRPKAIITAYGTAAAEFSYMDIPVLTIFDNPFTAYDFTYLASSIEEYKVFIKNIMNLESKCNKEEIIQFYYMHNYFFLCGRNADYLKFLKYKGDDYSDRFLEDYLPKMTPTFFKELDHSIIDAMKLIEWENEILKLN